MSSYKPFLGAALIAVSAAIILPVLFGEAPVFTDRAGGDPWRNAIYDFQTLITGILAVGAALVTTYYLGIQIRVAQTQAHDTFTIELRRTLAIAKKGGAAASELRAWITLFTWQPDALADPQGWKTFKAIAADFQETIEDEVFATIEGEIAYPRRYRSTFLRNATRNFMTRVNIVADNTQPNIEEATNIIREWKLLVVSSERYCVEIEAICREFLSDSEALIAKYK